MGYGTQAAERLDVTFGALADLTRRRSAEDGTSWCVAPTGRPSASWGVYREIVPAEGLVNTESWEDWDPGETLVTTVLVERGGKTTFTSTLLFPSQEVRDTVLKGGLERGANESYDMLADVLASTPARGN